MSFGGILEIFILQFESPRKAVVSYTVWSGMITVSTALGKKATQVRGSGSQLALDWLAKRMLRELAQEGNA